MKPKKKDLHYSALPDPQADVQRIAEGVEQLADMTVSRLDDFERRITGLGGATRPTFWAGADADVKSAMGPEALENVHVCERDAYVQSLPKHLASSNPVTAAAAARWFQLATYSGIGRWGSRFDGEEFAKLTAALGDPLARCDVVTKASLAEDVAGTGGNLVPEIVEADIARKVKDAADIFPLARQVTMRSKVHQLPAEDAACTVAWIEEATTLTAGEPTFKQITLTAEKLAGRATMSLEVVQDSAPGLLQYLLEVFSEKMAGELDYQLVHGDGSGPVITGLMNSTGINAITSATAAGVALTWTRLVSLYTAAGEKAGWKNGVWICTPSGYSSLIGLSDTAGNPVVHFGAEASQSAPAGTVLGRPVIVSNRLAGVGANFEDTTNSTTTILFGDPKYILAGTRQGMIWDVTDQVNWSKYQADARLVGRFAGNISVPAAWSYMQDIPYTAID